MRPLIQTANKFDTIWAMVVMFPAFVLLFNAAVALHQGTATPAALAGAANEVAITFTGQYMPYIETTSAAMLDGITKLASMASSCMGQGNAPVYTNPAMAHAHGCSLSNSALAAFPAIRSHRTYR